MAEEGEEEIMFKGARPRYVTIYQRLVAPPAAPGQANPWFLVCTMPSDVHHWRMYGVIEATGGPGPPVMIAFIDEPAPDEWIPLIGAEQVLRYEAPKAIYAQSFAGAEATLVIVEVWRTKLPARVKDKEKSKLGVPGRRQA
jgi:hypothetical protein